MHQRVGIEQQHVPARGDAERLVVGGGKAAYFGHCGSASPAGNRAATISGEPSEEPLSTTNTSSEAADAAAEQALEAVAQHGRGCSS